MAAPCVVIVNDSDRTTNGKRDRQYRIIVQREAWFDLRSEFVTQIQEPTARKWQCRIRRRHAFLGPPFVKRRKKTTLCLAGSAGELARFFETEHVARKTEQYIEAPEFTAMRGALQKKWIAVREFLIEHAQLIRAAEQNLSQML